MGTLYYCVLFSITECCSVLLCIALYSSVLQFETKNKVCVWGCGASRQSENISISKNKAPPLLFKRVKWSPFRHYHSFYYLSQYLRTKIKFLWGCDVWVVVLIPLL